MDCILIEKIKNRSLPLATQQITIKAEMQCNTIVFLTQKLEVFFYTKKF